MSFKDIFKNSFLNGFSTGIDARTIIFSLIITLVLGMYIFLIYRLVTKKTFYATNFNLSLISMAVITSAIILTIQSNIVLSLGMVGALSIVRFRTAIKDPLDLVFLYWAISVGIICGAGLTVIAVVLSLLMTFTVVVMQKYPLKKLSMILIVNAAKADADVEILSIVKQHCKYYKIKSKNLTPKSMDLIIEVKVDAESKLVNEIIAVEGVTAANLLSHDGDVTA